MTFKHSRLLLVSAATSVLMLAACSNDASTSHDSTHKVAQADMKLPSGITFVEKVKALGYNIVEVDADGNPAK